jgi:hypothetical protein
MTTHKFKLGSTVWPSRPLLKAPAGGYKIVRLLPSGHDNVPIYRVKHEGEVMERVMKEHELATRKD